MPNLLEELDRFRDEIQAERNDFNRRIDLLREEKRILTIALNLSGRKEELEEQAYELIKKEGLLRAVVSSRRHGLKAVAPDSLEDHFGTTLAQLRGEDKTDLDRGINEK